MIICCVVSYVLKIEQKEIETLEIELKQKVASLSKLKKELEDEQVWLIIIKSRTADCPAGSLTAPFDNMRNLKFKSPPTEAFSPAINHNLNICMSAINGP